MEGRLSLGRLFEPRFGQALLLCLSIACSIKANPEDAVDTGLVTNQFFGDVSKNRACLCSSAAGVSVGPSEADFTLLTDNPFFDSTAFTCTGWVKMWLIARFHAASMITWQNVSWGSFATMKQIDVEWIMSTLFETSSLSTYLHVESATQPR
jgi:hypothetical protein